MHIIVVGADHNTASIALRERLACSTRQIPQVLRATRQVMQECVLLSTCNRIELYAVCQDDQAGLADLYRILKEQHQIGFEELEAYSFSLVDQAAVNHLLGVASGLHSLVPGEPQIQGQVAEALEIAQEGGFAGPITSALFRAALATGKRARTETSISRKAVSVSHVAVQLAREIVPNFNAANILLIGSGQMSELAARNLRDNGAQRLVVVNRTHDHAVELAQRLGAVHRTFAELAESLVEADVAISSTTSPHALITRKLMQRVMERREGRSLLLIDIALPRDIEPEVAGVPGVHLYNIDDLQTQVNEGLRLRMQEVEAVQSIILEEAQEFERWLSSLSVVDTISSLRRSAEEMRQSEVKRALHQLGPALSEREEAIVNALTTRLMNKLLHKPMARLKEAAAEGEGHIYAEALHYLFDLQEPTEDIENRKHEKHNHRNASKQTGDGADQRNSREAASAVARSGDTY